MSERSESRVETARVETEIVEAARRADVDRFEELARSLPGGLEEAQRIVRRHGVIQRPSPVPSLGDVA